MTKKEAKALGLKTYNTGKPCKHHPDKVEEGCERYASNSLCVEYVKEYNQTPRAKEHKKEYRQTLEAKEHAKEYRQTPEVKESRKNREKKRRETPEYKEYIKEYHEKYHQIPEVKEHQKEYQKEYAKNRAHTNIQFRLARNLRARLRSALKNGQKVGSAVRDLGCSVAQCKLHLESQFELGMSWDNWSNKEGCWSIDHIKPLSSFNLKDRQQCLEACHYTNLRPMWHTENLKKGAKY